MEQKTRTDSDKAILHDVVEKLPSEMLGLILSFLDSTESYYKMSLVSKDMKAFVNSTEILEVIRWKFYIKNGVANWVPFFADRDSFGFFGVDWVLRLKTTTAEKLWKHIYDTCVRIEPHIKYVLIGSEEPVSFPTQYYWQKWSHMLNQMLNKLYYITTLTLENVDEQMPYQHLPRLTSLVIRDTHYTQNEEKYNSFCPHYSRFEQMIPSLQRVVFTSDLFLNWAFVMRLIHFSRNLQTIRIEMGKSCRDIIEQLYDMITHSETIQRIEMDPHVLHHILMGDKKEDVMTRGLFDECYRLCQEWKKAGKLSIFIPNTLKEITIAGKRVPEEVQTRLFQFLSKEWSS
jgi:hypothetical protein